MTTPPLSASHLDVRLVDVAGGSPPSQRALDAAESFNALMIEQMLNTVTKAKYSVERAQSTASEQYEYLRNQHFSDAIAKSAEELNNRVAQEIERKN